MAFLRVLHDITNPLVQDDRPVGPGPGVEKIGGELHSGHGERRGQSA